MQARLEPLLDLLRRCGSSETGQDSRSRQASWLKGEGWAVTQLPESKHTRADMTILRTVAAGFGHKYNSPFLK